MDRTVHGTFVPWTVRSMEHSFPRSNRPLNIRSQTFQHLEVSYFYAEKKKLLFKIKSSYIYEVSELQTWLGC